MDEILSTASALDGMLHEDVSATGLLTIRQVAGTLDLNEQQAAQALEAYARELPSERLVFATVEPQADADNPSRRCFRFRVHCGYNGPGDRLYGVLRPGVVITEAELPAVVAGAGVNALTEASGRKSKSKALLLGQTLKADEPHRNAAPSGVSAANEKGSASNSSQTALYRFLTEEQEVVRAPAVRSPDGVCVGSSLNGNGSSEGMVAEPETKRLRPGASTGAFPADLKGASTASGASALDFAGVASRTVVKGTKADATTQDLFIENQRARPMERTATIVATTSQRIASGKAKHPGTCRHDVPGHTEPMSEECAPTSPDRMSLEQGRDSASGMQDQRRYSTTETLPLMPASPRRSRRRLVTSDDEDEQHPVRPDARESRPCEEACLSGQNAERSTWNRQAPEACFPALDTPANASVTDPKLLASEFASAQTCEAPGANDLLSETERSALVPSRGTCRHPEQGTVHSNEKHSRASVAAGKILEETITPDGEILVRLADASRQGHAAAPEQAPANDTKEKRAWIAPASTERLPAPRIPRTKTSTLHQTPSGTPAREPAPREATSVNSRISAEPQGIRKFFTPRPRAS